MVVSRAPGAGRAALLRSLALGRRTFRRYLDGHGELLAAALAFYGLLSLAPLLLLAVMLVGPVFEQGQARRALLDSVARVATPDLAAQTAEVLDAMREATSDVAAVIALLALLWAASRLFVHLQQALNAVWGVQVSSGSTRHVIGQVILRRLLSFAMVAACGGLLMLVLVLNTVLSAVGRNLVGQLHFGSSAYVVIAQNYAVSFAVLTGFFAIIYRVLPAVDLRWSDLWVGASLTTGLLLGGTLVLNLTLGRLAGGWVQGSMGSVAGFVFWLYYEAQAFLLGAAFTWEWSQRSAE